MEGRWRGPAVKEGIRGGEEERKVAGPAPIAGVEGSEVEPPPATICTPNAP